MLEDHLSPQMRKKSQLLQRFIGYALSGDCSEQIMGIFVGEGCNGRSTLCNLLLKCFPTITELVPDFEKSTSSSNRIVLASEIEIDKDIFERVTDRGVGRSNSVLILDTTDTPQFSSDKMKIFEFPAKFVEDPQLPHERKIDRGMKMLKSEDVKRAFTSWIVEGAMSYFERGLEE